MAVTGAVTVVTQRGVATITLDRPDKRNAMSLEMWAALGERCRALAGDPEVAVVVVRGAGQHFCAGADVAGLRVTDQEYVRTNLEAAASLAAVPQPTIAGITGSCVGGGVQIATSCDLRIADSTALFGITPARLGIIYPAAALERAVHLIGPSAAKHLLFSAELIDAERALRIGLTDEVHAPDALEGRLAEFAALLAEQRSHLTQQASKAMVDAVVSDGRVPPEVMDRWATEVATADDPREGVAAFLERRPPRFSWRSQG
jgi:enoyl-CoA hydratase/carnithine racemase